MSPPVHLSCFGRVYLWLLGAFFACQNVPANAAELHRAHWLEDYGRATELAQQSGRKLLLWITGKTKSERRQQLWQQFNRDRHLVQGMHRFVLARVPAQELLQHKSLKEMLGLPGIVIIDWSRRSSRHYGRVVSVFPFRKRVPPRLLDLRLLLHLPDGSLTQRTLIFAVRKHFERPASTRGACLPLLMRECEKHSTHQADLLQQGHHNWESRFQDITARLPGRKDLVAQEVCAESWPNEPLLQAAEECVHSWRQSSGHWGAVSKKHAFYGYDMKRGKNGIWYATGIFGTTP